MELRRDRRIPSEHGGSDLTSEGTESYARISLHAILRGEFRLG
jgi:hypothetical protein